MIVFEKPHALTDTPFHYCPGCTHGIVHRLVAEVIDEMGVEGTTVGVAPVGCSVFAYNYFNCDMIEAPHGRAHAVATGVKRSNPDLTVFTYQGDGDLAAIGTAETVHVGARGENITIIFINNAIYGMTGGQMAPTTLLGQVTTTSPYGRDKQLQGNPIRVCEMMATLDGTAYAERVAVDCVQNVRKTKTDGNRAFAQGLLVQQDASGNLRVMKMDFWRSAEIGEPWMLEAPRDDGAHLLRYTAQRAVEADKPILSGTLSTSFAFSTEGKPYMHLALDAASYAGWVRCYTVTISNEAGVPLRQYRYMTDFYRYPQYSEMPRRVEITVPNVIAGEYTVSVTAQDCWGNTSDPLTAVTK